MFEKFFKFKVYLIVDTKKKNIFVIEDNVDTQLILKVYLRANYNVEVCSTGEEGLELLKQKQFDILLLDINLPGSLNGAEVLKVIRHELKNSELPVIIITAYALKGDMDRFLDSGANNYLTKPINKQTLLNEIKKLLA